MTDLQTLLNDATRTAPTTSTVVDADLHRAVRARRRVRTRRGAMGLATVAAAAVVGLSLPGLTTGSDPASLNAALVDYSGEQPDGFVVDRIPAGWDVHVSDEDVLALSPEGGPRFDLPGEVSFEDRIGIQLQDSSSLPSELVGPQFPVGAVEATLFTFEGDDGTKGLFIPQPAGTYLVVQVPGSFGWTDDQIVALGSSVHATDAANVSAG